MTPAQLATFSAAIAGDANLAAARAALAHGDIAAYYAAPGSGFVWRPRIEVSELNTAIDWAAFAALTVQKQNAYFAMTQSAIDATSASIRNGFNAVFGAGATLTALTALAQRTPTRFEALFTTGNVCSVFGKQASVADVVEAMG